MSELERRLIELGRELDYPPTPELAATVTSRLRSAVPSGAAPPRLFRRAGLRRALALAVVAVLLFAGTVFAAVPSARDAVLDLLGLQGATVERTTTLPAKPPERPLDLGRRTTLGEARDEVAFAPLVPRDPGEPDSVYVRKPPSGGELSLVYRPRHGLPRARSTRLGLLVSEFRGDIHPDFVGKLAGPGTRIERLTVGDRPAIWIEGAQHFFFYRDPSGDIVEDELRLAQNVLLLERGRVLVRLEGAFARGRAVAIAASLR